MTDTEAPAQLTPGQILSDLRGRGVDTVIIAGADTHGIMRGKRMPLEHLARVLGHGMPMCDVFWIVHVDESDLVSRPDEHSGYFPTARNGYPDIVVMPDSTTLRVVPWHERTALMLCDFKQQDGAPIPISPRVVLQRVVERARGLGLEPMCGIELEFYILRETPNSILSRRPIELVPLVDRPSTYGVALGSSQEAIGRLIRESALAYELPVETCNPETGPGQFEITLRYGPAVKAADDAFMFKTCVKELAAQENLMATFMAKPHPEWAGNSCHIHISLRDGEGSPLFHDPAAEQGMSRTMRHFLGGMLASMAELSAIMAPTVNSYRRFVPYSWAGTTATWGIDNRTTGLRVICEGADGTRVEHRQAGGDVNPYLGAAAVLAGGLCGIEHELEPPARSDCDMYASPPGQTALPRSLREATDLLEVSQLANELLGEDFVGHFVAMKRAEIEAEARAVTDWEVRRYLEAL
jgi:glutamine synthetase